MKIKKRIKEASEFQNIVSETLDRLTWAESFAKDGHIRRMADDLMGDVDDINDKIGDYKMYLEDVNEEMESKRARLNNDIDRDIEEAVDCFS